MIKVSWQDHFKNSLQTAESRFAEEAPDISFLLFCLREKMIPSSEYLAWALENYELPILSDKYFQNHKPQTELYRRWQAFHSWSGECLPILEWDGLLYVACLEVPKNYTAATPTVFVLASHDSLWNWWRAYQDTDSVELETTDPQLAPLTAEIAPAKQAVQEAALTNMAALAAVIGDEPKVDNFIGPNGEILLQGGAGDEEISLKAEDEDSEKPLELAEESEGAPAGLFEDLEVSKKSPLLGLQPVKLDAAPPHPVIEDTPPPMAPAPTLSAKPPVAAPTAPESEIAVSLKSNETVIDEISEVVEAVQIVAVKPTDHPLKKGPRSVEPIIAAGESIPNPPKAPVKPTMNPGSTAAYFLEKLRNHNVGLFDQQVNTSLRELKPFFKKTMFLAVGDKDSFIKPLVWDKEFINEKPQNVEFNMKTPSIFKVVSGTQKPYHGYVIVNDLNESFFETWNQGQVPDHVTIVPVLDGDNVVGMIMGIGEKSSYNKNVLAVTETIAKDLTKKILKPPQEKVA